MAVSGRRQLAVAGVGGVFAYLWRTLVAVVARRPRPSGAAVMMHRFDSFVTWHDRPKHASAPRLAAGVRDFSLTAIVVQGALLEESNFTLESVRAYRAYYPDALIYVSTWAGLGDATRLELERAGAVVITSERPTNAGSGNINLQIVSSRAGMEAAKAAGAQFAVKTRSDQRLYSPKALPLMHELLRAFPIDAVGTQQARIVTSSLGSFKVIPYHVSDMFNFGTIEDMVRYWSPELDEKDYYWVPPQVARTPRNFTARDHCEIYLLRHFLAAVGDTDEVTMAKWWQVLAERFVVIDAQSVDLLWPKYTLREYRHRDYTSSSFFEEIQFSDWMLLARDPSLASLSVPEDSLDHEYPWPLGARL